MTIQAMIISGKRSSLLPPKVTALKLFVAGSTLGPLVDSLHNQCLLTYDFAPIVLNLPHASHESPSPEHLFISSWAVPPLLGFAYIVLGFILPSIFESLVGHVETKNVSNGIPDTQDVLRTRAILAVSTTAAIIKLSEFLETHSGMSYQFNKYPVVLDATTNIMIMMMADVLQWMALDRTIVGLLAATVTAVGGPLSELPFIANGFWHYNTNAADYLPLGDITFQPGGYMDVLVSNVLGENYKELSLSAITGPCYFAVTLDAIALGKYFYQSNIKDS